MDEHLARLGALLRPGRAGVELTERDPDPPPDEVGAVAGVGYETPDADVVVSVYVFEGQEGLDEGASILRHQAQGDGTTRLAQNGPLLFYGLTRAAGDSERQLRRLASAFAGDE